MTTLNELSESLSGLVEATSPSLVTIVGRRVNATATVWASGGLLVTANHNLPRKSQPIIRLADGTEKGAKVLGRDPATDLALLQVDDLDLPVPTYADEGGKVGSLVVAVGNSGSGERATLGMVSRSAGPWRTGRGGDVDRWLEVDGSLPMGFSGGPLLATDGTVLGINTRGLVRGGTTLPTPTLRRVLSTLHAEGRVRQGTIGVGAQPVEGGLLLSAVVKGSPAESAGLQVGDILTRAGDDELEKLEDLFAAISASVESPMTLEVKRGDAVLNAEITPAERKSRGRCGS